MGFLGHQLKNVTWVRLGKVRCRHVAIDIIYILLFIIKMSKLSSFFDWQIIINLF